jgi:hypothetical protein
MLYFECSDEDDHSKTGFSKDGKHQNPQSFIGLLVGLGGYAIGYYIFEGNTYEGHTVFTRNWNGFYTRKSQLYHCKRRLNSPITCIRLRIPFQIQSIQKASC